MQINTYKTLPPCTQILPCLLNGFFHRILYSVNFTPSLQKIANPGVLLQINKYQKNKSQAALIMAVIRITANNSV